MPAMKIAITMTSALVISMAKVKGSKSAIASVAVSPGMAPNSSPRR